MTSTPHDASPRPWRSRFARLHPKLYLGAHGLAGTFVTIGLVWLFLAIADEFPEHGALARVDTAVARWMEMHNTEPGEAIFFWVSYLGAPALVAMVVAAVVWFSWRRDWRRMAALALATGSGVVVSGVLKTVFHRGRPEMATEFITRQSWSFPSGHAMNSMIGYGFLAVLLIEHLASPRERRAVVAVAAILIGVIGFSRLYLDVHYLSDVVGGWLAGAAWLLVCVSGYRIAERRRTAAASRDT